MHEKAWRDSRYGVVPRASDDAEDILTSSAAVESPSGRVPKMPPDRAISSEGQPIREMRAADVFPPKEQHRPAKQPLHKGLARLSLWWEARHPGVPQRVAKRGVARAFKWHHLEPASVPEFGTTTLLGKAVGAQGRAVLIHGVLVFGWAGSPGECAAFARAAKREHERRRPGRPALNDAVRFASKWLMDDGAILEPVAGLRPWLSADELDGAMERARGDQAANVETLDVDGEFAAASS